MRRVKLFAIALALAPALMSVTSAGLRAQTVLGKMQWVGVGHSFPWWWRADDPAQPAQMINRNVYGAGAYSAKFQFTPPTTPTVTWPQHGTSNFGPAVDIYCVDFTHTANTGTYDAYFTKLNGALTNTRANNQTKYLQVAWLATKMETFGTSVIADKAKRAEIHAAMWWILSGEPKGSWNGLTTNGGSGNPANYLAIGSSDYWVQQALANYGTVNAGEWTIVTDKCVTTAYHNGSGEGKSDSCSQEFMTRTVATPEPATMLLLGTGLLATLAMSGMIRRPQG